MTAVYQFAWPAIESFQTIGGVTYRIDNGKVYSWPANVEVDTLYDEDYITTNYRVDDAGNRYIVDPNTGIAYPAFRALSESFSQSTTIKNAVGIGKNWNSLTLHSSLYERPQDYVAIRQDYFNGLTDFLESRLDIVDDVIPDTSWPENCESNRVGECCVISDTNYPKILRCYAPPVFGKAFLCKASIDNELLFFSKGDKVTITGTFYREKGIVTGIMDFEAAYIVSGPGLRILFNENSEPRIELKWGDKPTWTQLGTPVNFPLNTWTKFEMYFELTDENDGVVQLQVDDVLVIDGTGQTLPTPDTVYTRFECGITAATTQEGCVVYAKDISIVRS